MLTRFALLVCGGLWLGCHPAVTAPPPPAPVKTTSAAVPAAKPAETCGLGVDGTLVVFEETPDGARLYFLTSPAARETLRARAQDPTVRGKFVVEIGMPDAKVEVDEIEEGAVLAFASATVGQRNALRVKLYARALEINDACRWELLENHFLRHVATPL